MFINILLLSFFTFSQKLDIQIGTGAEIGWWVYNKGSDNPALFNTKGWDRSHLSLAIPLSLAMNYRIKRLQLGAKIDYTRWYEHEMVASDDTDEQYQRYAISKTTYINFFNYALSAKFELVKKKNFSFLPYVAYGSFSENSIHPQKSNFGKKWSIEIGFENQIHVKNHYFWIRPKYIEKRIIPKNPLFFHEKHHIYTLVTEIGWGLRF